MAFRENVEKDDMRTYERPESSNNSTLQEEYSPNQSDPDPDERKNKEIQEQQTETALAKSSVHDTSSVPNGGLKAWLQVLGGFFVLFNTWGILNTFGAYQTYYKSGDLFVQTSSAVSWIGSIQAFMVQLFGLLSGPLVSAYPIKICQVVVSTCSRPLLHLEFH